MKQSILVTGANGQLGKCLQDISILFPGNDFHFLGRDQMPLEQFEITKNIIETLRPSIVINAAAYTTVDRAETEQELAFLINGEAVGNLASACKLTGSKLLHVSTDYVFDGNAKSAYKETDAVAPVNQYGASKLKGEQLALATNPQTIIVRTSWVYSRHGNNFVKTMLRLMHERESIGVVNDQQGCPTYAIDLADALLRIALSPVANGGIYHFSNSGPITWFDFAKKICDLTGSKCLVNPISTTAFPTPAKRPYYTAMSNEKIKEDFGITQKKWLESLSICLAQLK